MHHRPPVTRRAGALVASGAAILLATGCSAAPDATPRAGVPEPGRKVVLVRDADERAAVPAVELRSRVTRVAGHLTDVRRERVARQARVIVQDYLEGAFGGEDRPFRRFQAGLRRAARADARVLTDAHQVGVARAAAWFSVAAPEGRPVGITARLRVEPAADGRGADLVTGRLLLTRAAGGGWQVFGYDLARGRR